MFWNRFVSFGLFRLLELAAVVGLVVFLVSSNQRDCLQAPPVVASDAVVGGQCNCPPQPSPTAPGEAPSSSVTDGRRYHQCGSVHRCVLSYALYGQNARYERNLIYNAGLIPEIYPGWEMRVYVDGTVSPNATAELAMLGADVVRVQPELELGGIAGMYWRFLVADDPSVDRYLIRDADSPILWRERWAVDEWISSGKKLHVMRDNPYHCLAILGGTWGGTRDTVPPGALFRALDERPLGLAHGGDQDFLRDFLWNELQLRDDHLAHDSYCCEHFPGARAFPRERESAYVFVGMIRTATGTPSPLAMPPCPLRCRPPDHPQWEIC